MDVARARETWRRILPIGITIFLLMNSVMGHAQSEQDLQKVRNEIQALEDELATKENRERSLIEQVENAEREIGLKRKFLKALEQEKQEKQRNIRRTEGELQKTLQGYERMKKLVAQRMVSSYTRGRTSDWEVFFTLESFNQAMVLLGYQKRIVENDRRNLRLLEEKERKIASQRDRIARELAAKDQLLQEESKEAESLEGKKTSRQKILTKVRQDQAQLREKLRRKRQAFEEIRGRISRAEQQRKSTVQQLGGGEHFAGLKGKLDWPVRGTVITRYGRVRDPELKIWTENLGIDIKAADGDAVRCVCRGEVIQVYWMRGMGNVVLVAHGGGYYTVYGHMDVVLVEIGNDVEGGEVIGYVGDSQGLNGSTLHFMIWNGTAHYNPVDWMRKASD